MSVEIDGNRGVADDDVADRDSAAAPDCPRERDRPAADGRIDPGWKFDQQCGIARQDDP